MKEETAEHAHYSSWYFSWHPRYSFFHRINRVSQSSRFRRYGWVPDADAKTLTSLFETGVVKTDLEILQGKHPASIPFTYNERADLILNMKIADKLGIIFRTDLLQHADIRW